MVSGGLAVLQRNRTVHSENRAAPQRKPSRTQRKPSRPKRKASQHSTLFAKIEIFIECCDGLEAPANTKAPVPIVVVPNDVLCRDLGLAAFADRVDHDVQKQ